MKILIPVDGTASANRAVEYVIASRNWLKETPQVLLLNVQWKIATGNVKLFISQQTIDDYYREQGTAALKHPRALLDAAGMAYSYHISVGIPASAILDYAAEHKVDQIVLGAGEKRTLSALLLGSVADKVLHLAALPVVLIK
ncbi:MAG TPA: universal stress protein [Gallionellaceae bacterium]|nr:universal stress protein [Gallionellaceae bacterium]